MGKITTNFVKEKTLEMQLQQEAKFLFVMFLKTALSIKITSRLFKDGLKQLIHANEDNDRTNLGSSAPRFA